MIAYADTNLLTRVYLRQEDTEAALALLESMKSADARPLPITWLHRLEIFNAFQLHVFAARSPGQFFVTPEQAALAEANFRADLAQEGFLCRAVVPMADLERLFEELSLRHTARHGFRTYDLLHVASALALKCDTFWSFDPKASKLATLEGLKVRR